MSNKKRIGLPLVMLGALLLTSCGGSGYETYPVTGEYMTGKLAKSIYNAYLSTAPSTLNPTLSQSAENVSHLANLVGTLVMNDNYGILRRELASKAQHSSDNKVFTFDIRNDVPWVTSDGNIYKYKDKEQYVTAEDFVTTAKEVLKYDNQSEIYYMYTLFINNAWEYYCFTMMTKFIAENKEGYKDLKGKPDQQAIKLTELVKEYSGHEPDEEITGSDITKISNFERVGVKVNDKGQLVYTLRTSAQFFPTMLTYTPYMPTNKNFYNSVGKANGYGTTVDKMLYCGPFRLTEFKANSVKYAKNDKYFGEKNVHVKNVNYTVVDASTSYKEMREAFDRKDVDGFSLNQKDETGWKMYVTGEDGKGTIQNPSSDKVNSRELDDVDYTYHFNLNINRSTEEPSYKNATYWDDDLKGMFPSNEDKVACIENTNKALKIKEFRKLVLNAISMEINNEQFTTDDKNQYQMNTFTPRGYVFDEYGKDYIDFYYEEYAEERNLSDAAEAKALVGPQQISGVEFLEDNAEHHQTLVKYPWLSLTTTRNDAIKAVTNYSENVEKLSFPIIVDYMGSGGVAPDTLANEQQLVQSWNERANCCTINSMRESESLPHCKNDKGENIDYYPYFYMVEDKISNSSTWSNAANNGYYTIGSWGWVGDYADPLTYMHCYVTNGEMAKMSGNNAEFTGYHLEGDSLVEDEGHMLKHYNDLVDEASKITTSNYERYQKFAEAEYYLLNELYLIKPEYMMTQGWAASVSRACGYENPSAHYGLADHSLKGIWVLDEVPSGKERASCREKQNNYKTVELQKYDGNTINAIYVD